MHKLISDPGLKNDFHGVAQHILEPVRAKRANSHAQKHDDASEADPKIHYSDRDAMTSISSSELVETSY